MHAKEETHPSGIEKEKPVPTLDSILRLIDDQSLTIKEKMSIGDKAAILPYEDYARVIRRNIYYAKQEKDRSYLINLYCTLYRVVSLYESDMAKGKVYIDSAYTLIDETNDPNMKGNIHYCLGDYYANFPESEDTSHENLYKAIHYFEQTGDNNIQILHIYFLLGNAYINRKDLKSTKVIMDKMAALKINNQTNERVFLLNAYSVTADYYKLAKEADSIYYYSYNDSIIHYSKKMIDIYESLLDSVPGLAAQKAPIIRYYNELALALADRKNPDWEQVISTLDKGKTYIDSTAYRYLRRYYSTEGRIFLRQQKFNDAETSFFKEKELLDNSERYDDTELSYIQLYLNLSTAFEGLNRYKEALLYHRMAMDAEHTFNEQNRYESIKEIETKYETAKKELEISRLNEERQKIMYNRTLATGISVVIIILLLMLVLHNRSLRLKKEKEALRLSVRINEKEAEYTTILKEAEFKQMRHYLDGLEAERDRLAKGLHDNVSNRLFILDLELKKLTGIPEAIPQQVEELYAEVRGISHELIPPVFQYTTLLEILIDHIHELNENTDIYFDLEIEQEDILGTIPSNLSHEIYRIVQECTGNITKHSSAKNAKITLGYNNSIVLIIEDDGIGFDPQNNKKGIGIQIIKSRCQTLNGNIRIFSEKGRGSRISVTIPLVCQGHLPSQQSLA